MLTQVARGIDRVRGALPHLYQLAQVLLLCSCVPLHEPAVLCSSAWALLVDFLVSRAVLQQLGPDAEGVL